MDAQYKKGLKKNTIKPSHRIDKPDFMIRGIPTTALRVNAIIATVKMPLGEIRPI